MRVTFLVFIFFILFLTYSCSTKIDQESRFPLRNYFLLDSLSRTLDPLVESDKIIDLNEIPDSLVSKWVLPFQPKGIHNKMMSYQYGNLSFSVITIIVIDDLYIDKLDNRSEIINPIQYILTVTKDGKLIDGKIVAKSLSKDQLGDDFFNGNEIMSKRSWAEFQGDTIKIYESTLFIKETVLSERRAYVQKPEGKVFDTLQTILQEEFEGIKVSFYVIDIDGRFKKCKYENSDNIKKLSQQTGERIKI